MDAKAIIDSCGIGCEPASAASLAGVKKLVERYNGSISVTDNKPSGTVFIIKIPKYPKRNYEQCGKKS